MNRNIIITGGSGGLGNTLSRLFEQNMDNVYSLSRTNKQGVKNHYFCDVTDEDNVNRAIDDIALKCGNIDILILCSGIGLVGDIQSTPVNMVKSVFDVNFFGAINTVKAALKYMNAGAKIISLSSAAAFFPLPYRSAYSASKSALNIVTAALDMETKHKGIGAISICPGEIANNFSANRLWNDGSGIHKQSTDKLKRDFKDKKRMDTDTVAQKIYKIINNKNYKPVYIIGCKYKLFYIASKLLPVVLTNKLIYKMYGPKKQDKDNI